VAVVPWLPLAAGALVVGAVVEGVVVEADSTGPSAFTRNAKAARTKRLKCMLKVFTKRDGEEKSVKVAALFYGWQSGIPWNFPSFA
jgi:hypothetical protein